MKAKSTEHSLLQPTSADATAFGSESASSQPAVPLSHTRIGDPTHNVYGGAFSVPADKMDEFWRLYYQQVFVQNVPEHLTETRTDNGPLLVDFDFRYPTTVTSRPHTTDDIEAIVATYLDELAHFFEFSQMKEPMRIYVMEKPNIVRDAKKNIVKDGIHILFGLKMGFQLQTVLRDRMVIQMRSTVDLPLTNEWDKIIDEGISTGVTNWTVYGSRKPGQVPYLVTHLYEVEYNVDECGFEMSELPSTEAVRSWQDLWKLSAKYEHNMELPLKPSMRVYMESEKTQQRVRASQHAAAALLASTAPPATTTHADADAEEDGEEYDFEEACTYPPSVSASASASSSTNGSRSNSRKSRPVPVPVPAPAPAPAPAPVPANRPMCAIAPSLFARAAQQWQNLEKQIAKTKAMTSHGNGDEYDENAVLAETEKVIRSAIHPAFHDTPSAPVLSAPPAPAPAPTSNSALMSLRKGTGGVGGVGEGDELDDDQTVLTEPNDDQTILTEANTEIRIESIVNQTALDRAIAIFLDNLDLSREMYVRETHEFTQILPKEYYEAGSHYKNRCVAYALKHTDERLFLSWIKLRSKADDFDYSTIPKLYQDWQLYFAQSHTERPITRYSIMYWAKQGAPEEYAKLRKQSLESYINIAILTGTDWDVANVLRHLCADRYVCADNRPRTRTWYVYRNHRWELDKGQSLRKVLSEELHMLFYEKGVEEMQRLNECQDDDMRAKLKQRLDAIAQTKKKLKSSANKNNYMCEAAELMFDGDIEEKMDENPMLMGFTNGVVDFEAKVFRNGHPSDYISKSTLVNYLTPEEIENVPENAEKKRKILEFMHQVYPDPEVFRNMFDHYAGAMIGVQLNQDFYVLIGSGSNGKSAMADLVRLAFGQYFGVVPVKLFTGGGRVNVGSHSDEIVKLKALRYALGQEIKKDTVFDEGVVKELTGGSTIQARGIFKESVTFMPQFTLDLATNAEPRFNTNDDGTWRRIRKVEHDSKFVDEGEKYTDKPKYVFPKNKELSKQFPSWASVFASMLVHRAFETDGKVTVCSRVMEASNAYRRKQDCLATYIEECIERRDNTTDRITITGVYSAFKEWYRNNWDDVKTIPKREEVRTKLIEAFGNPNSKGQWVGYIAKSSPDQLEEDDDTTVGGNAAASGVVSGKCFLVPTPAPNNKSS